MIDILQREVVIVEAKSWIGTPFHHNARKKGIGVDCSNLLAACYEHAEVTDRIVFPEYKADWFLHVPDDRYAEPITSRCFDVPFPEPGDIVLFRHGNTSLGKPSPWSHGGIYIGSRLMIHAKWKSQVEMIDLNVHTLARMPVRYLSPKVWHKVAA